MAEREKNAEATPAGAVEPAPGAAAETAAATPAATTPAATAPAATTAAATTPAATTPAAATPAATTPAATAPAATTPAATTPAATTPAATAPAATAPAATTPAATTAAATTPAPGAADDPRMAQLRGAVDHFVAGNFAAARRTVGELLEDEVPPEIRKPADELVRRLGLDPVALWIAVGSTLLFIVVVVLTYRR